MARVKQASKRKRVTKTVPVLGAAGLTFSLVGGASAAVAPTQDIRGRRTLHRVKPSRSVKRKSPTSAWRHSMSSTRRTPRLPERRTGCLARMRWLPGMQGLPRLQSLRGCGGCGCGGGCCCRGVLAASAEADRFPITLTNEGPHGRARHNRPGRSCRLVTARPGSLPCSAPLRTRALRTSGFDNCREMPARELDEGIQWSENTPCTGEPACLD